MTRQVAETVVKWACDKAVVRGGDLTLLCGRFMGCCE